MHSSTGQTHSLPCLDGKATLPVNWIYPVLKADRDVELSDWTEVMQERFQRDYASMRENQQATVCQNAPYYKPILSWFDL